MPSFCIFRFFFILVYHHASCAKRNSPRKNLIVEFNPYVSILDSYDQNRYNISELLPLVAKVATEFDHVLIDLKGTVYYGELSSSLLLSPLAVASYNAHRNTSQPKLQVWLALSEYGNPEVIHMSLNLKYIAEMANDIYEGTVSTILLPFVMSYDQNFVKMMQNEMAIQSSVSKRAYKWGVVLSSSPKCNDAIEAQKVRELKVDIAVLEKTVERLRLNLSTECKPYKGNNNLTFWFRTQDKNQEGEIISMTMFLDQWSRTQKLADQNDMPVVVSSAFDVSSDKVNPFTSGKDYAFNGWWRLRENPDYSNTSEYIFEAKKEIAERVDAETSSLNLTLVVKSEQKLAKEHVGIGFSFRTLTRTEFEDCLLLADGVLEVVIASYSKILVSLLDDKSEKIIANELNCVARYFIGTMDILFYIPYQPHVDLPKSIFIQPAPNQKLMFVFEFRTFGNLDLVLLVRNQSGWDTKIGFVFPISLCVQFERYTSDQIANIVEVLGMSDMALFSFVEFSENSELQAVRMLEQRLVTFAQCGKFLNTLKNLNSTLGHVEMGFVMENYAHSFNYYEEAKHLYNFVLYWDKLREWAVKKETTVIMSGVLDEISFSNIAFLGWWRRRSEKEMRKLNSSHQFIDKRTELFRHPDFITKLNKSREHEGHNSALSTNQIVAISASVCLAIFLLTSITVCVLTQKYYKRKYLSSREINDFFRGNENRNDTPQHFKLPYDKSKFEIEPKCFSIDHSLVLGSGEFGMVCPGKVAKSDGTFVSVAVKMVNINKYHKSALTGLLSEIKVLAHVGKHENIIELHGAYTADLKRGKIFVFLELGECGSLEKFLRNLCPQPNANNESSWDEDGVELAEMQTYVNTAAGNSVLLDASLSDDRYRWSREICSGMAYLASKHVVHADLAARNILLNSEKAAKICDFGLSRRMYNYANYVKRGQDPLPWKWMPPESLTQREFNEKSDVWAYGVTLWEIYSLGATPYPGLSWDPNFSQMLERGFRMGKPKYNDRNMYTMMKKCWSTNPLGRPSFADLLLLFDNAEMFSLFMLGFAISLYAAMISSDQPKRVIMMCSVPFS